MNKILVTCAFPYANGPIHLGHLLEHIQADIWVRFQRMEKKNVYFICSDDAHGTAILLKSQKKRISPEKVIKRFYFQHINDFKTFNIEHDFYYTTHSKINLKWVNRFYYLCKKKKYLQHKKILQFYDSKIDLFLPDRLITGNCPKCNAKDQFGDACELCGSIYNSWELIKPISKLSKTEPILKETDHYFFKLSKFKKNIDAWIYENVFMHKVKKKVIGWLNKGINNWNISRDYPYFGLVIPNRSSKFFYVWVDALIGYISTFKYFCIKNNSLKFCKKLLNFKEFWKKDSSTEFFQFIGKDIIYFHTIIFPSILEVFNLRKVNRIFIHGHIKLEGKKMSKSKKNFVSAQKWYKNFDSDSLRYYFANKISGESINDINLNKEDFLKKINNDLVNKIVNLAARSAKFINSYYANNLYSGLINNDLYKKFLIRTDIIRVYARQSNIKYLIKEVLILSDIANKSFDKYKPWRLIPLLNFYNKRLLLHSIITLFINLFRILITCIKPIVPCLSYKAELFLNNNLTWENLKKPLLNHKIKNYKVLYSKIEIKNREIFK